MGEAEIVIAGNVGSPAAKLFADFKSPTSDADPEASNMRRRM
ncbi:hypothetical protein [Burkholderia cepacia]|nr:hypothetical protein [Burkholderia cepacia]